MRVLKKFFKVLLVLGLLGAGLALILKKSGARVTREKSSSKRSRNQQKKRSRVSSIRTISSNYTGSNLNERQKEILRMFGGPGRKLTNTAIQKELDDVTERTLRRDLGQLIKSGLIEKVGKTKGSYYVLK